MYLTKLHAPLVNRSIKEMFDLMNQMPWATGLDQPTSPAVNITEHPTAFEVALVVPGYAKEEIQVTAAEGWLTIKGSRSTSSNDQPATDNVRVHRREFRYGAFEHSLRLGDQVDAAQVSARLENGILTLTVPKKMPVSPEARTIEIA